MKADSDCFSIVRALVEFYLRSYFSLSRLNESLNLPCEWDFLCFILCCGRCEDLEYESLSELSLVVENIPPRLLFDLDIVFRDALLGCLLGESLELERLC